MKATITIKMDNAAFDDLPYSELARMLRELANKIEINCSNCNLMDLNGNKVGKFSIKA